MTLDSQPINAAAPSASNYTPAAATAIALMSRKPMSALSDERRLRNKLWRPMTLPTTELQLDEGAKRLASTPAERETAERKRTGIEPAVRSLARRTIGFEDRARHQSRTRFRWR